MNIRFANSRDKNTVFEVLNELGKIEDQIRGYNPLHTKAHVLGCEMYDEIIKDKNMKIFLAEENKQIVGVATVFLIPYLRYGKKRGYIIDLVVDENVRGKGIGSALLKAIKNFCKKNDILRIKVDTGLPDAKKFYAKNNGKITTETFTFSI